MNLNKELLRSLHSLHRQREQLQDRLDRGPRRVAGAKAAVDQAAAVVEDWRKKARDAQLLADRKQLDLKSSEQKISDWRVQLNTCNSNKEYQTLLEQIAAAEMAGSVLQDEILETLERIDGLDGEAQQSEQRLEQLKSEMQAVADEVAASADGLRTEIARVNDELTVAEKELPGELTADYQRVVRHQGAAGMAEVEDDACGGCGQQLSLNMKSDLILTKPVFCGGCGALLYLPE